MWLPSASLGVPGNEGSTGERFVAPVEMDHGLHREAIADQPFALGRYIGMRHRDQM
jgi:hypothetical protein